MLSAIGVQASSLMSLKMRLFSVFLLLLTFAWAAPVGAHAMLMAAEPPEGAVLSAAISQLKLHFMSPISVLNLRLASPGNIITNLDGATLNDNDLIVPAPANLGRGTHLLIWRVIGQDTHPSAGILTFSVGEVSETPIVPLDSASGLNVAIWLASLLLNVSLFVGVGGVMFRVWVTDGRPLPRLASQCIPAALVITIAAAVMSFGLQGLDALGASWRALGGMEVWRAAFATNLRYTVILACLAAVIAICANRSPTVRSARLPSVLAFIAAGAAIATMGHVAPSHSAWTARFVLFVHAACLIFWIGALVPLAALFAQKHADAAIALKRFSAAIPWPLAALVLSGAALSASQLQSPSDMITTPFGVVLSAKLGIVLLLISLAAYNRYVLTGRYFVAEPGAGPVFASSIGVELVLVIAVIGVAGLWRSAPPSPPRESMISIVADVSSKDATAVLMVTPGFDTYRSMTISLSGPDSLPLQAEEVRVTATHMSGTAAPIRRTARMFGDGQWKLEDMYLPLPGNWMFDLAIRLADSRALDIQKQIVISR